MRLQQRGLIALSSFLSAPKKGYNLRTLGPQRTFAKKWWALKVLIRITFLQIFLRKVFEQTTSSAQIQG
jgi:hypothetical protein